MFHVSFWKLSKEMTESLWNWEKCLRCFLWRQFGVLWRSPHIRTYTSFTGLVLITTEVPQRQSPVSRTSFNLSHFPHQRIRHCLNSLVHSLLAYLLICLPRWCLNPKRTEPLTLFVAIYLGPKITSGTHQKKFHPLAKGALNKVLNCSRPWVFTLESWCCPR